MDEREEYLRRWDEIARSLHWTVPYERPHVADPPYDRWFVGGRLNITTSCLDRHDDLDRVAVYWEGEPGDARTLTYRELHAETVRLAAGLRDLGVRVGDRVALHLGWLPEAVAAMLACARIGAEYTVIPVTLPVEALALRLEDFAPRILLTQDGGWRHGTILPLKARADQALEATSGVERTVVVRRVGMPVDWFEGDLWYDDVVASADPDHGEPEDLPPDHPLVTVHLANRGGRPVSVRHGAANLAVSSFALHQYGVADGPVYWCAGDLSWLGTQAHGIIGPLLSGASTVMYEGTLDVPDPARAWRILARYRVSSLMTSPSVARTLRGWSLSAPSRSTRSLRRVTTIGEPLEPDLRAWLHQALGDTVTVADGWGQLELGGVVALDHPALEDALPRPGLTIVDGEGREVGAGEVGSWVMRHPWPGTMRAAEVQGADPTAAHWTRLPGCYDSGDLARRSPTGAPEFLGRLDEVVSVSGQLVSLNEVRDALADQPFVEDAEVFERSDPDVGRSLAAAVVLTPDAPTDDASLRQLQDGVREMLGGLSRPRTLLVLDRFDPTVAREERRRGLAALAATASTRPLRVTWEQVAAAAGTR